MSDDSITLNAPQHDKLGVLHCGVTREGFVAVAGDTHDINDGQEVVFDRAKIKVVRKDGEYTFTRLA